MFFMYTTVLWLLSGFLIFNNIEKKLKKMFWLTFQRVPDNFRYLDRCKVPLVISKNWTIKVNLRNFSSDLNIDCRDRMVQIWSFGGFDYKLLLIILFRKDACFFLIWKAPAKLHVVTRKFQLCINLVSFCQSNVSYI